MSLPMWFPDVRRVERIDRAGAITIERLCELAHTPCGATGASTERSVLLRVLDADQEPWLRAEREDYGAVELGVPALGGDPIAQARWALGCLAFSPLLDPVARATCRGKAWARIDPELPPARPQLGLAARAFVDEIWEVCRRQGLAIGALDPADELVVQPLSDDALHALRHARPRGVSE
jgi:hypothetical protein